MDEKIIQLQTKLTFQEDLVEQLNEVVALQQKEIDQISLRLDNLIKVLAAQSNENIIPQSEEVPPPHY